MPSAVTNALVPDVQSVVESVEMNHLFDALENREVSNDTAYRAFSQNPSFQKHYDSFNSYVLSSRGMVVFKNTDRKVWIKIQADYFLYTSSLQSLQTIEEEPTPVMQVLKSWVIQVKSALYQWWLTDGNQILADAETKFATWFME